MIEAAEGLNSPLRIARGGGAGAERRLFALRIVTVKLELAERG